MKLFVKNLLNSLKGVFVGGGCLLGAICIGAGIWGFLKGGWFVFVWLFTGGYLLAILGTMFVCAFGIAIHRWANS